MLLALAGLVVAGCSPDGKVESNADRTPSFEADQDDIEQARFEQSEGRNRWAAAAPTDYTLSVGYAGFGAIEIVFEGDKAVSTTIIGDEEEAQWLADRGLPLTVADAWDQVESIIDAAAASSTPPDGNCEAYYFTIRWDVELGYPAYYDALGPCDDGVGVTITVILASNL